MRLITDVMDFCESHLPYWNTISISGYHIREAGSTVVQELAFTFANAIAYMEAAIKKGLDPNKFGEKISFFCKKNSTDKLKLVIFDEADILSQESQNLLRRNIEIYSEKTRFCFLCNYLDKIIPAIQSRCVLIHFKRLDFDHLENYLTNIVRNESMTYDSKLLKQIHTICQGDCRQIITYLQKLHYLNMSEIDTCQIGTITKTIEEIDTRIAKKNLLSISLFTYAKELDSKCCSSKQCLQYLLNKAKHDTENKYVELFKNASILLYKIKTGCNPTLIKLNILMYYCHDYFGYD